MPTSRAWLVLSHHDSLLDVAKSMVEVRFHGRGGQGAVTAAYILVRAAILENKWGQAIPSFGAERRGAHVQAYARIASSRVPIHSMVKEPHVIIVLDDTLLESEKNRVIQGLRHNGVLVLNTSKRVHGIEGFKVYTVDATNIAIRLGLVVAGWPVVNTAMLGALAKATGIVKLESIVNAIMEYWSDRREVAKLNAEAARIAYSETTEAS